VIAFEIHGTTAMREIFVPGDIVVFAFVTVDHI